MGARASRPCLRRVPFGAILIGSPGGSAAHGRLRCVTAAVARKRFGQHFLVDRAAVEAIVAAIDPREGDRVVEIGPGTAALTAPLLSRLRSLRCHRDRPRPCGSPAPALGRAAVACISRTCWSSTSAHRADPGRDPRGRQPALQHLESLAAAPHPVRRIDRRPALHAAEGGRRPDRCRARRRHGSADGDAAGLLPRADRCSTCRRRLRSAAARSSRA